MASIKKLQFSFASLLIVVLTIAICWRLFIYPSQAREYARLQLCDYVGPVDIEIYSLSRDYHEPNAVHVRIENNATEQDYRSVFQLLHQYRKIDKLVLICYTEKIPRAIRGNETVKKLGLRVYEYDPSLGEVIRSCPNCSSIEYYSHIKNPISLDTWNSILALKNLEELKFSYSQQPIDYEQLCKLGNTSIKSLVLTVDHIDPRWPEAVSKCTKLTSLRVDSNFDGDAIAVDLTPLEKLEHLKSKVIYGWVQK